MDRGGDRVGRKILPLGQGALDLELLRIIRDSGYRGPIGILGHTEDDAEQRLRDNLDGLDWLVPQLDGKPAGPAPEAADARAPAPPAGPGRPAPPPTPRGLRPDRRRPRTRRLRPRGRRLRLARVRLPVVPPGRRPGGDGRPRPVDRRRSASSPRRSSNRVLWPGRQGQGGLRGRSPSPRSTAGSSRATSRPRRKDDLTLRDPATGDRGPDRQGRHRGRAQRRHADARGAGRRDDPEERRDLVRFLLDLGRPGQSSAGHLLAPCRTRRRRSPTTGRRSTPRTGRTGSIRSTATGSMTSTPRRPSTSRSSRRCRRSCPPTPGSTAGSSATGATRATRTGSTADGTRPTWARCSAASSAARA